MKHVDLLLIIFTLFIVHTSYAKDVNCEANASVQGEVISCSYDNYLTPLDHKVDQTYTQLITTIKSSKNVGADTLKSLMKAQSEWKVYRDSTCEFMFNKAGEQTVVWGEQFNCLMDFDNARIKLLKKYILDVKSGG